jgi:hypothetical protein
MPRINRSTRRCPRCTQSSVTRFPRVLHSGIQTEHKNGHLYSRQVDILGNEHWFDLGEVSAMRVEYRAYLEY